MGERKLGKRAEDYTRQEGREEERLELAGEEDDQRDLRNVLRRGVVRVPERSDVVHGNGRTVSVNMNAAVTNTPLWSTSLRSVEFELHIALLHVEGKGEEVVVAREDEHVLYLPADIHFRARI